MPYQVKTLRRERPESLPMHDAIHLPQGSSRFSLGSRPPGAHGLRQ